MREKEVQGAVKMSMNFLSAVTGATQDEDDNFNLSENNLQRQNSSMSSFSTPQKSKLTRQQSILSDQISEQSRFSDSNEFNMHEEYENYHTLTKMEQYFTWIDHLSKQHYKILLKQAYQSSELAQHSAHQDFLHYNIEEALNFEHVIGNKKSPGSSSLSNVLSQYGLLPSDLSIPWFCVSPNESKNNSPKAGIGGKVGAFTFTSTTSSASVPKLELSRSESFSRLDNRPDTSAFSTTGEFADITGDGDKTIRTKSRKESGKTVKKRVFVEKDVAHFKTYNPSSWRNDQIRQKAMGLNQVNLMISILNLAFAGISTNDAFIALLSKYLL